MLASGFGGLSVCDAINRLLPKEDVVLVADHAYAPYARRKPAVVADRLRPAGAGRGRRSGHPSWWCWPAPRVAPTRWRSCARALAPLPVIGIDGIVPQASARSAAGRVALLTGAGCLRGAQLARALKRERGGGLVSWSEVPGLREAVEGGGDAGQAIAAELAQLAGAGVDAIALGCPHASAVASAVKAAAGERVAVVDSAALAAERARRLLMRGGLTTSRRRPGRRVLVSSNPAAGQAALR